MNGGPGTEPRYQQAAAIVRARIAAGDLAPGQPAPSGAALARATGFAELTCRKALRTLIKDGTLVPGPGPPVTPPVEADANTVAAVSAAVTAASHTLRLG